MIGRTLRIPTAGAGRIRNGWGEITVGPMPDPMGDAPPGWVRLEFNNVAWQPDGHFDIPFDVLEGIVANYKEATHA